LRDLWAERTGVLSTQVLQEFYVNATGQLKTPLAMRQARSVVETYAAWCVDGITPADVSAAFQLEDRARIGCWDALILAVAVRSGASRVLSEDLNSGQAIAGLTMHKPFVG
jgi:predicted nucleic acid-binding protein